MGELLMFPTTPRLSEHARQRCVEMGVRTARVKAILRNPDMTWVGNAPGHPPGRSFAWSAADPDIAVYFALHDGVPVAITVVPRTYETYVRTTA